MVSPSPTSIGSIISTTDDDALRASCKPKNNTGNLCELIAGPGQILSIRQTINVDQLGLPILEEFKLRLYECESLLFKALRSNVACCFCKNVAPDNDTDDDD